MSKEWNAPETEVTGTAAPADRAQLPAARLAIHRLAELPEGTLDEAADANVGRPEDLGAAKEVG
jgi:hypothetical protein